MMHEIKYEIIRFATIVSTTTGIVFEDTGTYL